MNHPLHLEALKLVSQYKHLEIKLIDVLTQIEKEKLYLKMQFNSMFQYCTQGLGLLENSAYLWIGISRKCTEVPSLKAAIESGRLTPSKARRILPLLNQENSDLWIQKAIELPQRALEKEVVKENPMLVITEKIRPLFEGRSEFKIGIGKDLESLLHRCKTLVSKTNKDASWEEVLTCLAKEFIKSKDPVAKAERAVAKRSKQLGVRQVPTKRPIPAQRRHQVFLRDRGKCQATLPNGRKCLSDRWVEVHHLKPFSLGGKHEVENLITLCSSHHRIVHRHPRTNEGPNLGVWAK